MKKILVSELVKMFLLLQGEKGIGGWRDSISHAQLITELQDKNKVKNMLNKTKLYTMNKPDRQTQDETMEQIKDAARWLDEQQNKIKFQICSIFVFILFGQRKIKSLISELNLL